MEGRYKPYEDHLGNYGEVAEVVVADWLARIGHSVRLKQDKFGPDITCEMGGWEFTVEVERCMEKRWKNGAEPFPFSTLSVIERRLKYFRTGVNMVVSADMAAGFVIKRSVAKDAHKRHGMESLFGELRLMVPVESCLLVDLTSSEPVDIGMSESELFVNENA